MGSCSLTGLITCKPPSYKSWSGDIVPSTTKGRVDAGQEIIQMRSDHPHTLKQCGFPASHHKSHAKHRKGEELDGNLDDEKCHFPAAIVLSERIHKRKDKGCRAMLVKRGSVWLTRLDAHTGGEDHATQISCSKLGIVSIGTINSAPAACRGLME